MCSTHEREKGKKVEKIHWSGSMWAHLFFPKPPIFWPSFSYLPVVQCLTFFTHHRHHQFNSYGNIRCINSGLKIAYLSYMLTTCSFIKKISFIGNLWGVDIRQNPDKRTIYPTLNLGNLQEGTKTIQKVATKLISNRP